MQSNATSVSGDEIHPGDQISEAVAESYISIPTHNSLEAGIHAENSEATSRNAEGIVDCEINKAFSRKNVCVIGTSAAIDSDESIDEDNRCAVCFLQMVLPVQLPCNHIFCFLCVKGVTLTNSPRCALCRQPIPAEFLLRPTLVQLPGVWRHEAASSCHGSSSRCAESGSLIKEPEAGRSDGLRCAEPFNKNAECVHAGSPLKVLQPKRGASPTNRLTEAEESLEDAAAAVVFSAEEELLDYHWFYEGRNGWWRYDQRTSEEIESFYQKKDSTCQVMVAGLVFVVDFSRMLQYRSKDPTKRRKIKRDVSSIPIKGVAGISLRRLDGGEEEVGDELPTDDAAAAERLAGHTDGGRVDQDNVTRPRRFLTRDNDHNYAEGERRHLTRDTDHNYTDRERRLLTRDIDHNYADGGRRYGLGDTDHNYADGERRHLSRDSDHNYAEGERRYLLHDADHNYAPSDTLHNISLESVRDSSVTNRSTSYNNVQDQHRPVSVNCCISHSCSNNEHAGMSSPAAASTRFLDQRTLHQHCREGLYHCRGHLTHEGLLDPDRSSDDSGRFDQTSDIACPPSNTYCGDCNRPRCKAILPTPSVLQAGQMCAGNFDLPPCLHIHTCHNCHPSSSHCLCCHRVCSGWCSTSPSNVAVTSNEDATVGESSGPLSNELNSNCQGACFKDAALRNTAAADKSSLNCSCNSRQTASRDPCQFPALPNMAYHPCHVTSVQYDEPPEYYHIDLDFEDDFESGGVLAASISVPTKTISHQSCKPPGANNACTVELTCYNDVQASDVEDDGVGVVSVEQPDDFYDLATAAAGPGTRASEGQGSPGELRRRDQEISNNETLLLSSDSAETPVDTFGATTR